MNSERTLIVVPTYNERDNVARLVARLLEVAPRADVCLLDDDSPDGTAALCEELQRQYPGLRLLRRTGARGLGRAYLAGLRYGLERRYAVIGTLDADLSHNPNHLKAMLPLDSKVELEVVTQDQFHRIVATVWLVSGDKRVNINEAMLHDGHAWAYRRYMKDPKFCDIEQDARSKKLGLWAQPVGDWVYPPEWRFLKNGEIRTLPAPYEETREKCVAVLGLAGAGNYEPPK